MARCNKCGAEPKEITSFCSACGSKFVPRPEPISVEGESGAYYCFKHKKEVTRVTCGRCEKPICTKCLVVSAAGVRCRQCASHRTPIQLRGLVYDITGGLKGGMNYRLFWYAFLLFWIARMFIGCLR